MLWSHFGKFVIGLPVTVMTSSTDLEYLTQEQIDKVCESVESRPHITEHFFCRSRDSFIEMGEHLSRLSTVDAV